MDKLPEGVLWSSDSARFRFEDRYETCLFTGGSVLSVGDDDAHALPSHQDPMDQPGRFAHHLELYQYQSFDTGFRHEIESVFECPTSHQTKQTRTVRMAVTFNVHNLCHVYDPESSVCVTRVSEFQLTEEFAKYWDYTSSELKKLKEALVGLEMLSDLWWIRLRIHPENLIASALLAPHEHFENTDKVNRFRNAYIKAHFAEYLLVGNQLGSFVDRVADRIERVGQEVPCARFWRGRPIPEQIPDTVHLRSAFNDVSITSIDQQLSFSTWTHFVTVMVYGILWKSDVECEYQLNALRAMHKQCMPIRKPHWLPIILGTNLLNCPRLDMYEPLGVRATTFKLRTHRDHVGRQIAADNAVINALGGHTAISGFAGTGKTFWSYSLPQPYIMFRWESENPVKIDAHTFIYLALSSNMIDITYNALKSRSSESVPAGREAIIVRVSCMTVHHQITEIMNLAALYPDYFDLTDQFAQLEGTLGHWMLRFMGLDKHGRTCSHTDPDKYSTIANYYRGYADGKTDRLSSDASTSLDELRADVLRSADCIVTTFRISADGAFHSVAAPFAAIVDDAAGVPEPDLCCIYGFFPDCRHIVLLGDESQFSPTVDLCPTSPRNPFGAQMRLSAFSRCLQNGVPSVQFDVSRRCHSRICDIISPVIFESKMLIQSPDEARAKQKRLAIILKKVAGRADTTRFFLISTEPAYDSLSRSYKNIESAETIVGFTIQLVQNGTQPADVLVLSPCKAQNQLFTDLFSDLDQQYPDAGFDRVQIRDFTSCRGIEADVVIIDTVISDNFSCFENGAALNVAITRAKEGLFLFSNVRAIWLSRNLPGSYLYALLSRFRATRAWGDLDISIFRAIYRQYRDQEVEESLVRELQGLY